VTAAQKTEMDGSYACEAMHTALRKCCDSKITSAVYNIIRLIDVAPVRFDAWRMLGALVAKKVNQGHTPLDALRTSHAELEASFYAVVRQAHDKAERVPTEAHSSLYALSCAMACFKKEDWQGMAAYLGETK
jgi:hypothetical protein